jgi:predicted ATP-grasp superfamily ATP-dependent carboligase
MDVVTYQSRPTLRRPVLICSFAGWSDAGDAASSAIDFLNTTWGATPLASIDPEEFFDFQAHRPQVKVVEGGIRRIDWPSTEFAWATIKGADRDAILLKGLEPSMRWRTFSNAVLDICRTTGVELVVSLGALLAGRPHTRPIKVTGTASEPALADRLSLMVSRYEGPTGIIGVLIDACRRAGIPAVSLWAWVPHYLQGTPSPPATLELIRRVGRLLEFGTDTEELERASVAYADRVAEAVGSDPDITADVQELERQADAEDLENIPTADELGAEVERFLREEHPPGGSGE